MVHEFWSFYLGEFIPFTPLREVSQSYHPSQLYSENVKTKLSKQWRTIGIQSRKKQWRLDSWLANEFTLWDLKTWSLLGPVAFRIETDKILAKRHKRLSVSGLSWLFGNTVEPVYNGPVSGHPLLSGQCSKSRFFAYTNTVFVTCIKRPPLLSGRGHTLAVPCLSLLFLPVLSVHPWTET